MSSAAAVMTESVSSRSDLSPRKADSGTGKLPTASAICRVAPPSLPGSTPTTAGVLSLVDVARTQSSAESPTPPPEDCIAPPFRTPAEGVARRAETPSEPAGRRTCFVHSATSTAVNNALTSQPLARLKSQSSAADVQPAPLSTGSAGADAGTVDAVDQSERNRCSKWGKLRQTVKATTIFASAGGLTSLSGVTDGRSAGGCAVKTRKQQNANRRDSFLERFSTRQSGCCSAASVSTSSTVHLQPQQQGGLAMETTKAAEIDGKDLPNSSSEHKVPLLSPTVGNSNSTVVHVVGSAFTRRRQSSVTFTGRHLHRRSRLFQIIAPDGTFVFVWLTILAAAVLYNLWTCIAREAFPEIRTGDLLGAVWIAADAVADLVYLVDVFVQMRTGYLEGGLVVYDQRRLAMKYLKSRNFVFDALSLLPLDFLQFHTGVHPLIRFPRFLKAYRLFRFVYMVETRTIYPNLWRVANLSHVLFLGCHWFAAFYFMISDAGGYRGEWGYPTPAGEWAGVTKKYLRSLHWSTLTLTTIGDLEPPETNWEYLFTIVSYLIGVFVFATIVGQVGNVITNRNASRQEFERHLDGAKAYMRNHNVPQDMQQRVQRWYDYAWSRGRINGGGDINSLGLLPDKLKTELALHVNLETLRKVTIFHECEPEFLHDLVLKMKAYIFTPGDLICRKGEVAREMFIIADGLVEVISESGEVLTQMSAGNFFGEIGILNMDGGVNRRTADVRSVGYSELFVLSREDVLTALRDHPEAEVLIKEYGHKRLQQLDEHKKRRLQMAQANAADEVQKGGAVRKMVSTSTGLLKGMVEFGLATANMPVGPTTTLTAAPSDDQASGDAVEQSVHDNLERDAGSVRRDIRWIQRLREQRHSESLATSSRPVAPAAAGDAAIAGSLKCRRTPRNNDEESADPRLSLVQNGWPSKRSAHPTSSLRPTGDDGSRPTSQGCQFSSEHLTGSDDDIWKRRRVGSSDSRTEDENSSSVRDSCVDAGGRQRHQSDRQSGSFGSAEKMATMTKGVPNDKNLFDLRQTAIASERANYAEYNAETRRQSVASSNSRESLRLPPKTDDRPIETNNNNNNNNNGSPCRKYDEPRDVISRDVISPDIGQLCFELSRAERSSIAEEINDAVVSDDVGRSTSGSTSSTQLAVGTVYRDASALPGDTAVTRLEPGTEEIGQTVATFIQQHIMSKLATYERQVCQLEQENARKQQIIDRLRQALGESS